MIALVEKILYHALMTPSILLIRPQMGENIGAAARAMANFGLGDLRLVAPRDGWPNPKASDTAGRALNVIDDAKTYEGVGEALADCQFVLATTARERVLNLPVYDVREAMHELHTRTSRGEKCAVMFGPERTGLENEDLALADAIVTIPVAPEYASLNVGQAVVVVAYEWWMARGNGDTIKCASDIVPDAGVAPRILSCPLPCAPRAQLIGLFDQLEAALDEVNFWRVPEKKAMMWRNIRASLTRADLTEQEIATWRGILRALQEK